MRIIFLTPPQGYRRSNRRTGPAAAPDDTPRFTRGLLPPLGIGYLTAVLRQHGHEVTAIDAPLYGYDAEDLANRCLDFDPGFIGISTMTPTASSAYELARTLSRRLPGVHISIGGAHPTCYPEETFRQIGAEVDSVVLGEAEGIIIEMITRIEAGRSLEGVKGVWYRAEDGELIRNPNNDEIVDVASLPIPARDIFPIRFYAPEPYENKRLPATNIIVARGCTWSRCTFCERSGMMKRKYRYNSPQKTLQEVKQLIRDYGIKEFVFYDDDLLSNRRWVHEFCDLLLEENLDIVWSARGLVQNIRHDLLRKAKKAGLWAIFFGFESGDQDLLDRIKKGNTVEQAVQVGEWCHEFDIEIIGSFILALPGEDPVRARRTIELAKKLNCDYAAFIPYHPYEGTALHDECLVEGTMLLDTYTTDQMVSTRFIPRISYIPEGYESAEQIGRLVRQAYREFYLRPSYVWKHVKRVRSSDDVRKYLGGVMWMLKLLRESPGAARERSTIREESPPPPDAPSKTKRHLKVVSS